MTPSDIAATAEEDAKIKPVACLGYCMNGRRGMDRCAKCDGVGSQLSVRTSDGQWRRFPNTESGYNKALKALRNGK